MVKPISFEIRKASADSTSSTESELDDVSDDSGKTVRLFGKYWIAFFVFDLRPAVLEQGNRAVAKWHII
ncbi:Uncharacterised protein [Moraxella caviae]|uniref:Uncharacterized protein n=1 Tax=Moraxella caviae TaxID=34060 RepID=A0A378R582_9GAMM|nr:Uncharacterised protein [Moraxella caviae]